MSKRVVVGASQYLAPIDYERFGLLPQQALDAVISDALGWPAHWAAFTVAKKSSQEVNVSPGRFYDGDVVYEADDIEAVNLTTYFPTATSDEKFLALILRGDAEDDIEQRAFETSEDPETSEPVANPTPVVRKRVVKIVVQQGLAAPPPALYPTIAATDACLAFVRCTFAGIQDIIPGAAWRVKSVFELDNRIAGLELVTEQTRLRTDTLETGMANVNAAVADLAKRIPRAEIIREVRRDVAALRRRGDVPEGARTAYYDPALLMDFWDPAHAQWNARIDEGIQFPFANAREARLEVTNEDDPRLRFHGRRMVPAYTTVKRIANEGGTDTRLISQSTHVEIDAIQRSVSRTRTDYGPTINVCENSAEWGKYNAELESGKTFSKNGETFVATKVGEQTGQDNTHTVFAVRSVKTVSYSETYWDFQSKTVGLNGSVYGQTFLVDQPIICPSIELEFSAIGADGAVRVLFCETDETGAPLIGEIIAVAALERNQLRVGWNEFKPDLTFFAPGKRFAWYVVTTGNHQLRGSNDNRYTGGTSFRLSDGVWAQGDLFFDFNFRINGCRFTNSRTVVEFKDMTLTGGMTQFKLLYPNWVPDGTALAWEIQPVAAGGDAPWSKLAPGVEDNPLAGLPAQVRLRCTMLATQDLAPMIELGAEAVYEAARIGQAFQAVSDSLALGLTTTSVETVNVVDDFNPSIHTFAPRIMAGSSATLIAPDTTTIEVDTDKPSRRTFTSRYTVPAGTSVLRDVPTGATSIITDPFFVQNTAIFAL